MNNPNQYRVHQKTWNMLKMQPLLIPYTLIILLTMVMQIVVFSIVHMIILIHLHFLLIMTMMMMMNTIMAKACMRERLLVRNNKRINPKLFMKKKKMMTILMIRKVLFQQCPIYHRLKNGVLYVVRKVIKINSEVPKNSFIKIY